jgi:UDP-N-acetylmuramate dehydrogenase
MTFHIPIPPEKPSIYLKPGRFRYLYQSIHPFAFMIQILYDQSLKPFNTFGMDVPARRFCELNSETQLREFLADEALCRQPLLVLGGGSNILFTGAVSALVVKINLPGKEILSQDAGTGLVRAAAGENWDAFVAWTLDQGLFGLETSPSSPARWAAAPSRILVPMVWK